MTLKIPPVQSMQLRSCVWCEVLGKETVWLDTSVCATDMLCHSMAAVKGEGVSFPVADTLDAAAGLARWQKWGLILPSSARVFRLTHQTVIGVRYPELVKSTPDGWRYGRYVSTEATLQGDFLPVFWDVPKSDMHAVTLALWLSGCKNTSPLVMTQRITLQCFIIRTILG